MAAAASGQFQCCVVLDGWMWPIVGGSNDDISILETDFGQIGTATLFLDAEEYAADVRWWRTKQEICNKLGGSSQLIVQKHSQHYTVSDVLVLGGRVFAILKSLQFKKQRVDQTNSGKELVGNSSPEALLRDAAACTLRFLQAHIQPEQFAHEPPILVNERFGVLVPPKHSNSKL